MKRRLIVIIFSIIILASVCAILYPLASNYLYEKQQDTIITEYSDHMENISSADTSSAFDDAEAYNTKLSGSRAILTDPFDPAMYETDDTEYMSLLNLNGDGIMGYIEIPSINVLLPIYHGTSESVLEVGVGHLQGTSLPVGGEGTHTVLSGHTGLSNKRLFTDLTELQIGDYFTITVMNETLTYQVCEINVVLPYETDLLQIREGQDLVTLLTCTPYGINDHRLLVTGTRVSNISSAEDEVENSVEPVETHSSQWMSEYLHSLSIGLRMVIIMVALMLAGMKVYSHLHKKHGKRELI